MQPYLTVIACWAFLPGYGPLGIAADLIQSPLAEMMDHSACCPGSAQHQQNTQALISQPSAWLFPLFRTCATSCFLKSLLNFPLDTSTVECRPPTPGYFCLSRNCQAHIIWSFIYFQLSLSHLSSINKSFSPRLIHVRAFGDFALSSRHWLWLIALMT